MDTYFSRNLLISEIVNDMPNAPTTSELPFCDFQKRPKGQESAEEYAALPAAARQMFQVLKESLI